jgi:demethylmenaquinone methyltransferase/2-methoxy-6-polyprenyl-1,4-benzoquinol methylase
MAISRDKVRDMYQSGAKNYDFTTILFRLIGLRMKAYRSQAINKLSLQRGDFIIELGCGTGLNFPLIMEQIGPEGTIIGVDLTPGMLDIARDRIEQHGWTNVELVESDIVAYDFPESVNGVLATGLFGYIPEYDQVIKAASKSLVSGGQPAWQFKIVLKLGGPFGYTPEYFNVRPWEPVENYFKDVSFETRYGGMIYLLSGTVK